MGLEKAFERLYADNATVSQSATQFCVLFCVKLVQSSPQVPEALRLSPAEMELLKLLQQLIASDLIGASFPEAADVVVNRLLQWPPDKRFPALDVLRVMTLNSAFASQALSSKVLFSKVITRTTKSMAHCPTNDSQRLSKGVAGWMGQWRA